jgi:hypothetical protein
MIKTNQYIKFYSCKVTNFSQKKDLEGNIQKKYSKEISKYKKRS